MVISLRRDIKMAYFNFNLRLYPNLPGVVTYISERTQKPELEDNKPKFLVLGWHDSDSFTDGTPILFNEPYYMPVSEMVPIMFGVSSPLGKALSMVDMGARGVVTPVGVRIGKKSVKYQVDGGEFTYVADTSVPGSASDADGDVTISWNEADWRANLEIKVSAVQASDSVTVTINGNELEAKTVYFNGSDAVIEFPEFGLTVTAKDVAVVIQDYEHTFNLVYAVEPKTEEELLEAMKQALDELVGIEVDFVYVAGAVLDDSIDTGDPRDHFVIKIAEFCDLTSTQFRASLGFVGTKAPNSYTFAATKKWAENLANVAHYVDGVFDQNGNDIGRRVAVVAGHGYVDGITGLVDLTPFVAGYIAYLNPTAGPTNVELPGTVTMVEKVSLEMANTLSGARITPLYTVPGYSPRVKILVGRTGAQLTSNYTKISTILIANEYVQGLRNIADQYLGKPNGPLTRMAMESNMQKFTADMIAQGKIADGTVTVQVDYIGGTINTLNVFAKVYQFAEIEAVNIFATFTYTAG